MTVAVVNIVPLAQSGETAQDSEPNIAVNPADPRQIVATAFTPDPAGGTNAPIYVSTNGGQTWVLNLTVPSQTSTGDITVRYGGTTGALYAGILRRPDGLRMNILRTLNPSGAALMTVLVDRFGSGVDQPYVQAGTRMGGVDAGRDAVFVGNNDFNAAGGRTATIDRSGDGVNAAPPSPSGFTVARLDVRATAGQDMPAIRPAIHPNGTIYAVFYGWRNNDASGMRLCDVVVVRDDAWGAGATPFRALVESAVLPGDGLAGVRVARGVAVPFNLGQALGQERLVASNLSLAVDPRNPQRVYVAWADLQGTAYTLHVRRSTDGGATWSADLRTVGPATNPALAVNSRGKVGFLYQQLVGTITAQQWVTHLELTSDDWGSTTTDRILAQVPGNVPARVFGPYIGDYVHLMAVGKDFYGVFSANNTPNGANFPNAVTYQRRANFATQTLFAANGTTVVPPSIDPFFFRETEIAANADFYVRDWTDSPTSGDTGLEPSTHPVFYTTSDVWTRRSNAAGGFNANDQPVNEPPRHGPGPSGDNFAFVRVRRNATGSAANVRVHFLVSPLGTGSNFADAGTDPDPVIPFAAGDAVRTPVSGYRWHLDTTTTTHLCFAAEISTATDPIVSPSLSGRAPGWPTADLAVLWDNNKAQRNMEPGAAGGAGAVSFFGLIHNAATFARDLTLAVDLRDPRGGEPPRVRLSSVGTRGRPTNKLGRFVMRDMQPAENRWLRVTVDASSGKGESYDVLFTELVDGLPVNGFAIAPTQLPIGDMVRETSTAAANAFRRLDAFLDVPEAGGLVDELWALAEEPDAHRLSKLILDQRRLMTLGYRTLTERTGRDDFGAGATLRQLTRAANAGDDEVVIAALMTLANELDSLQTMAQKQEGDIADSLQMVEWQRSLFADNRALRRVRGSAKLIDESQGFVDAFGRREATFTDYPDLVRGLFDVLAAAARGGQRSKLRDGLRELEAEADSPQRLQRAHRHFLLGLSAAAAGDA